MADFDKIKARLKLVDDYLRTKAPTIMGVEAVNHFKQSFVNQGFTDTNLQKWEEVERRKPSSRWYGFQYGSTAAKDGSKRRKPGSQTNWSNAATSRPILSGTTQDLMNSIDWEKTATGIRVYAEGAQAKLINQGGPMKVFGRSGKTMPKRQFIGKSETMRKRIAAELLKDIHNLLK